MQILFILSVNMVFQHQDAWRNHKMFKNLWMDPFPGLKKAIVIYGIFMVCEYGYKTITAPPRKHAHSH